MVKSREKKEKGHLMESSTNQVWNSGVCGTAARDRTAMGNDEIAEDSEVFSQRRQREVIDGERSDGMRTLNMRIYRVQVLGLKV